MHVQILHPCQSAEPYSVSLESLGLSRRKSKPRRLKFLAQLSRRLIGELIVRPSVVRRQQFQTSTLKPLGKLK